MGMNGMADSLVGREIKKAVVPAAGLGTRLLSATKEQPKEMLPVFALNEDETLCLKPMVQQIFEQLFDLGIHEFYFIVGRDKRAMEDHFTPDCDYVNHLNSHGKNSQAVQLKSFYRRIDASMIVWVNQPEPKGFGDAVLRAKTLVGDEPFLVHAGDTLINSRAEPVVERLAEAFSNSQAVITLQEVEDPRQYGVAEVIEESDRSLSVRRVVEKPSEPASKLAIMPLYLFNSTIFEALGSTQADENGELQLTDAMQKLIENGHTVHAIKLRQDDTRLDIGTPETYWKALELSHRHALCKAR